MFSLLRLRNHLAKVCALVATILILPLLAYATQNGTTQNGTRQNFTVMPEVNPVWVLVPFFGAVVAFFAPSFWWES